MSSEISRTTRVLCTTLLALGLFAGPIPRAAAEAPGSVHYAGSWEGELTFREEPLAVRVDVRQHAESVSAMLDFPQLLYADQPADAALREGALVISFPFGLGDQAFRLQDGVLVAEGTLGEDEPLRVKLVQAEPFEPERRTLSFGASEPPLEGTLVLPPGDGPFPLILLAAGATDPHRGNWSYTSWADTLARRGIASFAYDRRPDGMLSPSGALYVLEDHARDLMAALDALVEDRRIDGDRVGVLGKSRGAWIGLATAALDPRIDFLVGLGGAAVGVAQQDLQMVEARMRATGSPEEDVQAALAYMRVYFHVAAHPDDWPRLDAATAGAREADWGKFVRIPETASDLDWFAAHLDFDPLPRIADLKVPVFYAWGAEDRATPPLMNRPLFAALLSEAVRELSRLRVYEGAGHTLEGPLDTDGDGVMVWTGMNPEFLADLWSWFEKRGILIRH